MLQFGGDYIRDIIINNAVPKVEVYKATVEYLNKRLDPKISDTFEMCQFKTAMKQHNSFAIALTLSLTDAISRMRISKNAVNIRNRLSKIKEILLY